MPFFARAIRIFCRSVEVCAVSRRASDAQPVEVGQAEGALSRGLLITFSSPDLLRLRYVGRLFPLIHLAFEEELRRVGEATGMLGVPGRSLRMGRRPIRSIGLSCCGDLGNAYRRGRRCASRDSIGRMATVRASSIQMAALSDVVSCKFRICVPRLADCDYQTS